MSSSLKMSKMENKFKYKKTAKIQRGHCTTNNGLAELQDQFDKLDILTKDIQSKLQKCGQENNERDDKSRRIDVKKIRRSNLTGNTPVKDVNKAIAKSQPTSPSWDNLGVKEGSRKEVWNPRGQKVRNPQEDVETACMGTRAESKEPAGRCRDSQKVSIKISMVSLEPGNKSSELVVPERRPPRVYPKLEEQSVGGGDALPPCSPDAQQTRLPGGSPKPPVRRKMGLVDEAANLEEPKGAHKPGHRGQVRSKVSKVSLEWEKGDQHGTLVTQQRGDQHGPLARRKRRGDLDGPLIHETGPFGLPIQNKVLTHKAKIVCTMILCWILLGVVQLSPHQLRTYIRRDPTVANPPPPVQYRQGSPNIPHTGMAQVTSYPILLQPV